VGGPRGFGDDAVVDPRLQPFLLDQAGVVSRRQAESVGVRRHELERLLRRRQLTRLHPGVYLNHTGSPAWLQLAWGGVLLCWPASLAGQSALRAAEGPGSQRRSRPIEVVIRLDRRARGGDGVEVSRSAHLEERVLWHLGPPRLRYEAAALDVAADAATDMAALIELSRAVQGRRTTAARLLASLDERGRMTRRAWLRSVLTDVAAGACSVLEHGYLTKVERAHGLAPARRQVRDRIGAGTIYRDVEYDGGLVVELDGRLFHDTTAQRDKDFDRDLVTAVRSKASVRLSYGQVFDRPCWTAGHVAVLLLDRGWSGSPRACSSGCSAATSWNFRPTG
jgi:hypothetical protein